MTIDDKLTAIRDAIQQDVGNRGLARDPRANLVNACPGDFAAACREIAEHPAPVVGVVTGFWIPAAKMGETDGPLGAVYLMRTLEQMGVPVCLISDPFCEAALHAGLRAAGVRTGASGVRILPENPVRERAQSITHLIAIERVGPSHTDDRCYTMRGIDISDHMRPAAYLFEHPSRPAVTIGVGDGGNEIGMGKVPREVIGRNIPDGERIACRVATDHLIVAGVSNWGAYAISAGVAILRGLAPPAEWFDTEREREILAHMVDQGPLVEGVTGQRTVGVDGLSWARYAAVLVRIGEIVRE